LQKQVTWWITLNEPAVYLFHGYLDVDWPPARRGFGRLIRAGRNLVRAHFLAVREIRETQAADSSGPQVGVAKHLRVFDPLRVGHRLDSWAARMQENSFNWGFPDSIARGRFYAPLGLGERIREAFPAEDFSGINYYTRDRVRFSPWRAAQMFGQRSTTANSPLSDLKWEIYPEGLARVARADFARYGQPIWITENGLADASDHQRSAFLINHLTQVGHLLREGLPVKGYFHWSLMDNFEWAEGYSARFGLVEMDYATQERRPRPSAEVYRRIARTRQVPSVLE
jgi:beta-glucosidase